MKRKDYLQYYKIETEVSDKGKIKRRAVYQGEYFVILNKPKEVKRIRLIVLVVIAFFVAVGVGLLFWDIPSSHKVYIILPNMMSLASGAAALYYVPNLFAKGGQYNIFQKIKVEVKFSQSVMVSAVLAGICVVIRTVFLIVTLPLAKVAGEIIMLLFMFFMSFSLFYVYRLAKKIRFESVNIPVE